MAPRTFTIAERPELENRLEEIADPWPEFLHHDPVVRRWWSRLYERFRDFQLVLYDEDADVVLGEGCSIPIRWDGSVGTLPEGVTVLESGFSESEPNVLSALLAVVDAGRRGEGLSGLIVAAMAEAARSAGLPFDPWIRLHHRLGAEILAVAPRSLDVRGTVAEWEEWTGMAFPETGEYVVPGALVPVTIDRERDEGRYVEPNVWMRHAL